MPIHKLNPLKIAALMRPGVKTVIGDGGNLYLQVRNGNASWNFRYKRLGKTKHIGIGSARIVSLKDARETALAYLKDVHAGRDPRVCKALREVTHLRESIAHKYLSFIASGTEPACYLYRHYHPNGDLLYVGVSLHVLARHRRHIKEAVWAASIYQIVIEPFETREAALEAEQIAIKTEFPKFNTVHNGHRSPAREITQLLPKRDDGAVVAIAET